MNLSGTMRATAVPWGSIVRLSHTSTGSPARPENARSRLASRDGFLTPRAQRAWRHSWSTISPRRPRVRGSGIYRWRSRRIPRPLVAVSPRSPYLSPMATMSTRFRSRKPTTCGVSPTTRCTAYGVPDVPAQEEDSSASAPTTTKSLAIACVLVIAPRVQLGG